MISYVYLFIGVCVCVFISCHSHLSFPWVTTAYYSIWYRPATCCYYRCWTVLFSGRCRKNVQKDHRENVFRKVGPWICVAVFGLTVWTLFGPSVNAYPLEAHIGHRKPNSITLSGSKLVADSFEAGRRPAANLFATSFEQASNQVA